MELERKSHASFEFKLSDNFDRDQDFKRVFVNLKDWRTEGLFSLTKAWIPVVNFVLRQVCDVVLLVGELLLSILLQRDEFLLEVLHALH